MVHEADPPAQQRGWDFGAVEAFKSVFNSAAKLVQDNTVGRAKQKLADSGINLSDDQMSKLTNFTLKLGESMLVPVPSDELKLTTGAESANFELENGHVELEDVELVGLEFWVYSFVTWEGPTLQIEKIKLGSIVAHTDSFIVAGTVEINGIKVQASSGNITQAVATCLMNSASSVENELPVEQREGGEVRVVPPETEETIRARAYNAIMTKLTGELKLEIASLHVEMAGLTLKEGTVVDSTASLNLDIENTALGIGVDQGKPTVTAHTEINVGGTYSTEALGVHIHADAAGKGLVDAETAMVSISNLKVSLECAGSYSGEDVELDAVVTVSRMEVQATSNTANIVDVVGTACREALTHTLPSVTRSEEFASKSAGEQVKLIVTAAQHDLVTRAKTGLAGELKAVLSSLSVAVTRGKYGEYEATMDVNLSGVQADMGLQQAEGGGTAALGNVTANLDLTASGKAKVDQAVVNGTVVAAGGLDAQSGKIGVDDATFTVDASGKYSNADVVLKANVAIKDLALTGTATGQSLLAALNTGIGKAISAGCEAVLVMPNLTTASKDDIVGQFTGWMNLNLMGFIADSLSVQLKASVGSITVNVDKAEYDGQKGEGSLTASGLEVGVSIESTEEGPEVALEEAHGEVTLDLKGKGTAKVGDILVDAVANSAAARVSIDEGKAEVTKLDCLVSAMGTIGEDPDKKLVNAAMVIDMQGVSIQTLGTESGLQDTVAKVVGESLTEAARGFFTGEDLSGFGPAVATEVQKSLATKLESKLAIKIKKLNVDVKSARIGDVTASGQLNIENAGADIDIDPENPVEVSFYGDILLTAVSKYKSSNLIDLHGIDVTIDALGNGHVEGKFQLHSDGVKEVTSKGSLGKLSKLFNKKMSLRVPIAAYVVQLNSIDIGLKNKVFSKIVDFAKKKIRVSNKSGEALLKMPVLENYSGQDLGQLPEEAGTKRILQAKQDFAARISQGAVSVEALLQNTIQAQLNAVRQALTENLDDP